MKVTITLDDDLMSRIDNYADTNYMSRSGFISLACVQYLNATDVQSAMLDLSIAMRKIADTGTIDHEALETLEDFERMAKLLIQNK